MRQAILIVMLAAAPVAAETKVFQAKHRPAPSLSGVLTNMQLSVSPSREFNTITLNGSAETIKVAEAILEKYDTPRRQAEFLLRVIEAGAGVDKAASDAVELVPAELKSMLKYNRYTLLDSAVLRGMEAENIRIALGGNLGGYLLFKMRDANLETDVQILGPPTNILKDGNNNTQWPTLLNTTATLKSGETVVLGASKMRGGNNALIVLVTAKLLP